MVHALVMTPPVGEADYRRVVEEVGTAPMDGAILHLCVRRPEGGVQYIDVWDSEEDVRRASSERILPAVERALGSAPEAPTIEPLDVVDMIGPFGPSGSRRLVRDGVDAWNAGDLDAFLAPYAEDCELTTPSFGGKGHEAIREFWTESMTAFPGCRLRGVAVVAIGDQVFEEGALEGTNTGSSKAPDGSEIPATGRPVTLPYVGVHRVVGGKIVSTRLYWDELGMIGALGLI